MRERKNISFINSFYYSISSPRTPKKNIALLSALNAFSISLRENKGLKKNGFPSDPVNFPDVSKSRGYHKNLLLCRYRQGTGNFENFRYIFTRILPFVAEGIYRVDSIAKCGGLAAPHRGGPPEGSPVGQVPESVRPRNVAENPGRDFHSRKAMKTPTDTESQS